MVRHANSNSNDSDRPSTRSRGRAAGRAPEQGSAPEQGRGRQESRTPARSRGQQESRASSRGRGQQEGRASSRSRGQQESRTSSRSSASARKHAASSSPYNTASARNRTASVRPEQPLDQEEPELVSTSVRELRAADRAKRIQKSDRRRLFRIMGVIALVVVLLGGWAALYHSPAFTIKNVEVNGVKHLTSEEMAQLANVPADTTLLRVDIATIESRVEQNAWVADAQISQVFPDTLVINVTERPISAIVEIPAGSGSTIKQWAISDDHIWLMPIPDAGSEASKTTSSQVYEDAEAALHIVDVPYGTKAEIGKECTDDNVNNALDIVSGLTTDLASRVAQVSAAGTAETTLILDDGVEIAFGKAEDIRDKERVILEILEENPTVAYINVRMVETPTWRAV